MNNDLRAFLEAVNDGMTNQDEVFLHEEDFVNGEVELSDDQIKQLFMILAQASVFKKIQGTLKGYKPPFPVDKLENLSEAGALDRLKQIRDSFVKFFGKKGDRMAKVAANTSRDILKRWNNESIKGGISSSVENVATWLKNKGVDNDLINTAFSFIGVPNIDHVIGTEDEVEVPEHSEVKQWLEDEMLQPGAFTGALARDFLIDKGVPEERADKMLARIGVKPGKIIAKALYDKLDRIANTFGGKEDAGNLDVNDSDASSDDLSGDNLSASHVFKYVLKNYNVSQEKLKDAFRRLGTSSDSDAPMNSESLAKLMKALKGREKPQETEDVMDKTQDIFGSMGGKVKKATSAAKKAKETGDYSGMTELQKLGIAILTARNKI